MKYESLASKQRFKKVHEYRSKVYRPEIIEDLKKDTYEVIHWVEDLDADGCMFKADYTHHHVMSKRDFMMYVEMGCPDRKSEHPWSHLRLYEAYKKKPETLDDQINKAFKKVVKRVKGAVRKTRNT